MKKYILLLLLFMALIPSLFSQTKDKEFNIFYKKFKEAVKDNDLNKIVEMTNFPFMNGWLATEYPVEEDTFRQQNFHPAYKILKSAKYDKTVTIEKNSEHTETVDFGYYDGYYVLSYTDIFNEGGMGYCDYFFSKINGEYKFIKSISGD